MKLAKIVPYLCLCAFSQASLAFADENKEPEMSAKETAQMLNAGAAGQAKIEQALANPVVTPKTTEPTKKQDAKENYITNNQLNINKADSILPDDCSLLSYTYDGEYMLYKCNGEEILSVVIFPKEGVTSKSISNNLVTGASCTLDGEKIYAKRLRCPAEDGMYNTYIGDSASKLIILMTVKENFNDDKALANLQNLSLSIYFFQRKIARDNPQIAYFNEILKHAFKAKDANEFGAQRTQELKNKETGEIVRKPEITGKDIKAPKRVEH